MMTEAQYQLIKAKVEREFPIRKQLVSIADMKKLGDETIAELFIDVLIYAPDRVEQARAVIRAGLGFAKESRA